MISFPVYLFDVDGTLLDSAADICAAQRLVLERAGCNHQSEEFLRSYIGRHLVDLFNDTVPDIDQARMEALIADYRVTYLGRKHGSTRVFPGVAEALARLPGKKATATTKSTNTTRVVLEQFGLAGYFDHVQGTDGFPAKPAPDVILRAIDALGARPDDCLLVGDSPADMEAGRRAGIRICAVRYGYGNAAEISRWQPDFWLDDLRELVPAASREAISIDNQIRAE